MKLEKSLSNKILAFDLGDRYIGCAISDEHHILASPIPALEVTEQSSIAKIRKLVKKHLPKKIIIGIPYHTDGSSSNQTKKYLFFAKKLIKYFSPDIEVELIDETLSSWEARSRYKKLKLRKSSQHSVNLDSFVAMGLLNQYLKIDLEQ